MLGLILRKINSSWIMSWMWQQTIKIVKKPSKCLWSWWVHEKWNLTLCRTPEVLSRKQKMAEFCPSFLLSFVFWVFQSLDVQVGSCIVASGGVWVSLACYQFHFKLHFAYCVCLWVFIPWDMSRGQRTTCWGGQSTRLNIGCQARRQVLFPTEPSW